MVVWWKTWGACELTKTKNTKARPCFPPNNYFWFLFYKYKKYYLCRALHMIVDFPIVGNNIALCKNIISRLFFFVAKEQYNK